MAGKNPAHGEPRPMGMIVLGDRRPRPEPADVLAESLAWAIELARVTKRANLPNHVCGLAAYDAWADGLEVDADYEDGAFERLDADSPETVMETRAMVHGDQAVMLHERNEAASFLRRMSEHAGPAADDLLAAADLYSQAAKAHYWPWKAQHWMAPEVAQGLQDRATRREIAAGVRRAGQFEGQAVGRLESALRRLRE